MISRYFLLSIICAITPLTMMHAMRQGQSHERETCECTIGHEDRFHGLLKAIKEKDTRFYQDAAEYATHLLSCPHYLPSRNLEIQVLEIYTALVDAGYEKAWADALHAVIEISADRNAYSFSGPTICSLLCKLINVGYEEAQKHGHEQLFSFKEKIRASETFLHDNLDTQLIIRRLMFVLLEVNYEDTLPVARELITHLRPWEQQLYLLPLVQRRHQDSLQDACDAISIAISRDHSYSQDLLLALIKTAYEPALQLGLKVIKEWKLGEIWYGDISSHTAYCIYQILHALVDANYEPAYDLVFEETKNRQYENVEAEQYFKQNSWFDLLGKVALKRSLR